MNYTVLGFLLLTACGPQIRALTYPSPCMDGDCVTTGWEVWGNEDQIYDVARDKCEGKNARAMVTPVHKDYGMVYCIAPEKNEAPVIVQVQRPVERPSKEVEQIDQATTQVATTPEPDPAPAKVKPKRSKRRHR